MSDIMKLTGIAENIREENTKALEDGEAEVRIAPVKCSGGVHLVLFVNEQAVYAPVALGKLETYSNCADELERYMNC
ncbi:hypothetical protein L1D14_04335 [Vibrio tubiashii]|uniref:hypothetical protein n=1 Tax=Vibrio tubiashii TaxID=29498 RepID=UPI001EFC4712|nr:hypothetical protein [Vibrio tubiashii]MCG9575460.1 hypothetical protein [Vibrio tubiashii]